MFVASNEFVVAGLLLLLSLAVADSEDVAVDGVVVAGIVAVAAVIFGADQDRERLSNKTLEGRDDGDIVIVVVVVVVHIVVIRVAWRGVHTVVQHTVYTWPDVTQRDRCVDLIGLRYS